MRIATKEERHAVAAGPANYSEVGEPMEAEEKDRLWSPSGEVVSNSGIIYPNYMVGAGVARDVRNKFVVVAVEEVYVPLKRG